MLIALMRFTFIQLIFLLTGACILHAHGLNAQKVLDKKISIELPGTSMEEVLSAIETKTGVHFVYVNNLFDNVQAPPMSYEGVKAGVILSRLLAPLEISYAVMEKDFVVLRKMLLPVKGARNELSILRTALSPSGMPAGPEIFQQQVSGRVTDIAGDPLPGVSVQLKGTTNGTSTDSEGRYTLENLPGQGLLVFTFIGFKNLEEPVDGREVINVSLEPDVASLDEVVVVGYGTQKAATITGSISNVSGEELRSAPAINLSNAMVGRLPGLVAVTRSGEPGSDGSTFRIRGANTLGDNSPLIVVDGIANRGLERLNAADIESITVLKDASAAIYGAQAANGVILVTTKRGRLGKPQISLNYNEGLSTPTVLPESIDAATYLEMLNEIGEYAGQAPKYSEEEIQNYREGTDPWLYPNTDWYAETFRDAAPQRSANLTISGGQEYLSYFISAGTQFQDAIYKNSATNYKQMNFRVNLDGKVSDNVRYSIDVSGREQYRNYPTRSASDIFTMLRRGKPHMHAYWPNGMNGPDIEYGNNPVVVTTNQTGYDRNKTTNLMTRAKLDVKLPWIEGLSLSGNVAFDRQMDNDKLWRTPWFLYSWDRESVDENGQPVLVEGQKGFTNPELTQEMEDADRLTLNALLNYERNFGGMHNFKFLAGTERISGESMIFSAFRKHFVSEAIDQLFAGGDADKTNSGQASEEARLNYFGRVNYDFKSKYLFEFVWRYDGSFIFPREKRFGFFPGVSLGWRISEENFWEGIRPVVSHLKIRGSWGQTGNDRIDTYQYMASYGYEAGANEIYVFNGDVESKILGELRIPNRNVTWEVANQSNIGFDGELFNSKVSFSADYFYNVREDILWRRSASVPASSGLTLPSENIGEVVNQGAEFQLGYRNKAGDLHYEVSANINFNKNRIKFWDETPGVPEYQQSTGHPMNTNLYYKAIGIFRDQAAVDAYPHWTGARPGDVIFEDVNQDGEINGLDRVRIYKTDLPTQTGGFNIDLAYKNFYSSIFFQWAAGAVRNDYYEMQGEVGNFLARDVEGRWTPENPDADQPRIWNRYSEYWRSNDNTYWLQSSDYVRLKSFELGYNLPASLCESLHMSAASIYFTGLNLLTFTGVEDFDPESTSAVAYPLNKVYNFGVTLTF